MPAEGTESKNEARRKKILAQGLDRLNHITLGSGKDGVSRSLRYGEQERPSRQASLTPAASGLEPGCDASEGAAQRSKSWLAGQESPPLSRKSSPDKPSAALHATDTLGDAANASPLAPAHSASLAPVSSPVGNCASDEEAASMPNSPTLTHSGGSSGTVVAEAPAFSLPAGSPQSMRPPASASGDPAASQMPSHSLQQAVRGSPGSAMPQVQPTAAAQRMQRRRINGTAAFQQALNVSAPARTLLAVICAAFFYSGGSEAVASAWERHIGQPLPGAALLQHVPPIAAMLPLQLLGMLLTFLLRSPVHQQPEAASVLGGLWAATGSVSPHLHSALGVMWPFYQHLWQDVAVYIFTVALLTEVGAPRYHGHWRHLHSLVHYYAARIPPCWRVAAGRWTL